MTIYKQVLYIYESEQRYSQMSNDTETSEYCKHGKRVSL